ncbi:MAG: lysophospholipid acyltransferase family protein [Pyrinomonadaceae bacterium]
MLEANKSTWFEKIFRVYNRRLFKRKFDSFRVCGLENLRQKNPKTPLIIYANHSSWWDGLAAFEISRAAQLDAFVMMEEKQLRKLFLFRKLGAFSVVRKNPREAIKSVNYAAGLLKENSRRTLWIFPQGEILPNDSRPLNFFHGLSRVVEKTEKCAVVSAAMRYEFFGNFKPEILVKINLPEQFSVDKNFDAKKKTIEFENELTETLDNLKSEILTKNLQGYENIF